MAKVESLLTRSDWGKIWEKYDEWSSRDRRSRCKECNHIAWEEQMIAIKRIVNKRLKMKRDAITNRLREIAKRGKV